MLGAVLVLIAALANASASVLQRRAARDEPDEAEFSVGMLWDLSHRPSWIGGILCMIVGFLLQAAALTVGEIALVQPLLIAELPLTLLLASWMFGTPLPAREWWAVGALAVGLAAFVFCLSPSGDGASHTSLGPWVVGSIVVLVVVALFVHAGSGRRGRARAALWGIATGAAFGLNAALVAGVGAAWGAGGWAGILGAWQTYGVIVLGPASFFLLQNALQAGPLDASQPGFTLVNPVVGVLWGVFVFDEVPRAGAGWVIGDVAAAALVLLATLLLVRSSALTGEDDARALRQRPRPA